LLLAPPPSSCQVVYFNFKERPEEVFDKIVEIKVLNAKKLISDALIGSFKFDLGMVYDEAGKRFMREPSQLDTVVDSLAFHTPSSSWCRPEQIFPVCFSVDSHAAAIIHNRNIIVILEGQEASCVS